MNGTVHMEADCTMDFLIVSLAILLINGFIGGVPDSDQDAVSYNKGLISVVIKNFPFPNRVQCLLQTI